MQALKRLWTQDVQEQLKTLAAETASPLPAARVAGEGVGETPVAATSAAVELALRPSLDAPEAPGAENIVRPAHFQRPTPPASPQRERPELATALDAVMRATDLIREAESRADQKAQRATDIALRTFAQLERAEAQIEAAHKLVGELEEQVRDANRRAQEASRAADAQLAASRQQVVAMEAEVALLNKSLEESRSIVADANMRAFAADARAQEARDDVAYLENEIRQQFALT